MARFIDGVAGSAFLSVAGGTVGDLFVWHQLDIFESMLTICMQNRDELHAPMMIFTASRKSSRFLPFITKTYCRPSYPFQPSLEKHFASVYFSYRTQRTVTDHEVISSVYWAPNRSSSCSLHKSIQFMEMDILYSLNLVRFDLGFDYCVRARDISTSPTTSQGPPKTKGEE